jgi:Domain of unknown function (DUF4350)
LPIQLSKGDRKLMSIAGVALLLMIAIAAFFAKPVNSQRQLATTYSTASGGAKAAYLLLKESGYDLQRWEESPTELSTPLGKTLILAEPSDSPTLEERVAIRHFVERGGKLIASGAHVGFYLPSDGVVPDPLEGESWKQLSAKSPSSITRAAPQITLAPGAYWNSTPFAIPLYGNNDHNMVVKYQYGQGEVLWMASATPLTNAGVKLPGNLEFLLASFGQPKEQKILWDEYFHGYRNTLTSSVSHTPVKWMFLQFALLAIVIVLTYSRRSLPVCVPSKEVRLSPLEFVRTLGALYEQADAASVAVDIYYQRFRYWLTRRLGLSAGVPVKELETAIRERWNVQDPDLNAVLQSCESAPYHTGMPPADALKLFQKLHDYSAKFELFSIPGKEKR